MKEIVQASHRVNTEEDLSVSFIQIGADREATKFLKFLDDSLKSQGAKFGILFFLFILYCCLFFYYIYLLFLILLFLKDIVDTVSATDLGSMSFEQLIQKSIYD